MLIRSLIVLLLALNIGVASWSALRTPAPDAPVMETPASIARLRLVGEGGTPVQAGVVLKPEMAVANSSNGAGAAPSAERSPPPMVCVSFGPFPDSATADSARQRLLPRVTSASIREAITGRPRGWKVYLPAYASLAEVEAAAQRIAAAGFADYFIVRDGPEANTLALGRFGGEIPARRHAAALAAAGFPAVATPIGSGAANYWVDVSASEGFDASSAQALVTASERRALDCPVRD